jgi:hypothetical protein
VRVRVRVRRGGKQGVCGKRGARRWGRSRSEAGCLDVIGWDGWWIESDTEKFRQCGDGRIEWAGFGQGLGKGWARGWASFGQAFGGQEGVCEAMCERDTDRRCVVCDMGMGKRKGERGEARYGFWE